MDKSDKRIKQSETIKKDNTKGEEVAKVERPRCLEVAQKGIRTGGDFAELMSGLMSDVIEGKVTPNIANATCNAGGKLLKVVEMQIKYATTAGDNKKTLNLLSPAEEKVA